MSLMTPISCGELLDKLTILRIKKERIDNEEKLKNINNELKQLTRIFDNQVEKSEELDQLIDELRAVNEQLWDIEDEIRACEKDKDYGERFIELARSVYLTNDKRANLKYQINSVTGSELVEEKSYEEY
jgi:septal ring factor EnvC (AmiA/AmiB activator)